MKEFKITETELANIMKYVSENIVFKLAGPIINDLQRVVNRGPIKEPAQDKKKGK
jgi:hypothetical protein